MIPYRIDYMQLSKRHPLWAGQSFYMVYDLNKNRYLLGLYVTEGAAEQAIQRRMKRENACQN